MFRDRFHQFQRRPSRSTPRPCTRDSPLPPVCDRGAPWPRRPGAERSASVRRSMTPRTIALERVLVGELLDSAFTASLGSVDHHAAPTSPLAPAAAFSSALNRLGERGLVRRREYHHRRCLAELAQDTALVPGILCVEEDRFEGARQFVPAWGPEANSPFFSAGRVLGAIDRQVRRWPRRRRFRPGREVCSSAHRGLRSTFE